MKKEFAASHAKNYYDEMSALGYDKEGMLQYIREYEEEQSL